MLIWVQSVCANNSTEMKHHMAMPDILKIITFHFYSNKQIINYYSFAFQFNVHANMIEESNSDNRKNEKVTKPCRPSTL